MKYRLIILFTVFMTGGLFSSEPDTLRATDEVMKRPALAIGLSAVLPGAGQMYNGKWFKGAVFLGAQSGLAGSAAYSYVNYFQLRDLYGANSTAAQNALTTAKRITWFSAAVYVYSLIDAYVDAHLSAFPDERFILEPDPEINGLQLSYQF